MNQPKNECVPFGNFSSIKIEMNRTLKDIVRFI